jgi:aryl sulfotransferase
MGENTRWPRKTRELHNHHFDSTVWNDLSLPGQVRSIAEFLAIPIRESRWDATVEHCSFDWMKKNATKSVPLGGAFWDAGAEVFIHKGVNGRWRDTLTARESAEYDERALAELGPAGARWLATGAERA